MGRILVANFLEYMNDDTEGSWFELGQSKEALEHFLKEVIGVERSEDAFVTTMDVESFWWNVPEAEDMFVLNELYREYNRLPEDNRRNVECLLEMGVCTTIEESLHEAEKFTLLEDIKSFEDLGYYYIVRSGLYDVSAFEDLLGYIDFEEAGKSFDSDNTGGFNSKGYLLDVDETL